MAMKEETYYSKGFNIATIVITLVTFVSYYIFYRQIYSYSFIFRQTAFLCISGKQQQIIMQVLSFQSLCVGLMTRIPKEAQTAFCVVGIIAIIYSIFRVTLTHSLVYMWQSVMFMSFTIFGIISYVAHVIMIMLDYKINVPAIFIHFFVILAVDLISHFYMKYLVKKAMVALDNVYEKKDFLEQCTNHRKLMIYSILGFQFAHPASLEFTVFKYITDKYPYEASYWLIYGKFVAIYPELSDTLSFIVRNMIGYKLKGLAIKQAIAQTKIIFQQRETNLTGDLKKKLNKMAKEVSDIKRTIRRIWDQVIQGNANEMDNAVASSYKKTQETDAHFNLLRIQLPNNRFLYRSYESYLREIKNDLAGFQQTNEQLRLLARGIRVHPDHTQLLGLRTFPNLPQILPSSQSINPPSQNSEMSENLTFAEDIDDEIYARNCEENKMLADLIENLTIPSLKNSRIFIIVIFVFSMATGIVSFALLARYRKRINSPKKMQYATDYARFYVSSSITLCHLYILKVLNLVPWKEIKMKYYNSEEDLKMQLRYCISQVINYGKSLSDLKMKELDSYIKNANDCLFEPTNKFTYVEKDFSTKTQTISLTDAMNTVVMRLAEIVDLNDNEITRLTLLTPSIMTPMVNKFDLTLQFISATDNLTEHINSEVTKEDKVLRLISYGFIVFFVIITIIMALFVYYKINHDKKIVYRTLMALPKNVVSQINEGLRIRKSGDDSSRGNNLTSQANIANELEYSKQEENMIKVLVNAADETDSAMTTINSIITCLLVFLIMSVILANSLAQIFIEQGDAINQNVQHVDNLMTIGSLYHNMFAEFNDITATFLGYPTNASVNMTAKINSMQDYQSKLNDYYNWMRYGYKNALPYPDFSKIVSQSIENAGCNWNVIFQTVEDGFNCFSPDVLIKYTYYLTHSMIDAALVSKKFTGTPFINASKVALINRIYLFRLIDDFIFPGAEQVDEKVNKIVISSFPIWGTLIIVTVLSFLVILIAILLLIKQIENRLRYALRLLLSCQPSYVTQNGFIMTVLTGNFKQNSNDSSMRGNEFYDTLVEDLPDSIIVTNGQNYKIASMNKSAKELFKGDLVGSSLNEYLGSTDFSPESNSKLQKLFDFNTKSAQCAVQFMKGDVDKQFLLVSKTSALQGDSYIFIVRNNTQSFMYNKLITEERSKSDQLLATILPATLVPRVQAGEKNISFSVPSATICFIDIVEFTPWCSSNSAQVVTGTLNNIFTEFDTIVASLPVMERVKCIGDCYMAAGGIFADTPNVLQFARSSVDFGLQAIDAIRKINEKLGMSLQVRVGLHIGGPVVAGVIGTGKPTFEIFGPAISMAQQMEHNGVPMKVHVSRSIYELIYGGTYKIEERGEIQIKQGKVLTYLVTMQ
ncbi:Adenylate and Guanylate cyclase catalytic domain containing protein [Trichomonas vaginalis G3]|uniref:Adenylate and Guanylate cyclase catalytic domain containing protein n=1 Tax=Trichomonas vaginalis (strain ATCC PRA-98 / G3) TaxID=412133 RepID=A2FTS7_TRIV3|nr:guanylate cyclase protein [Trichomonas vaginalis G3]EAX91684.1 Adenylate and Guanylate cyclase catalytic domain containing protein [Trichomonas vaginalis G3]KAI5541976.1 guanylate cyclase protein [Trichomonas vaginalis G3]|eukprot:XP_001304614.1 Adenylate and Guanylate cyclase catalytic domain containing protein [Trichomonas vaginalis G3]